MVEAGSILLFLCLQFHLSLQVRSSACRFLPGLNILLPSVMVICDASIAILPFSLPVITMLLNICQIVTRYEEEYTTEETLMLAPFS